MTRVKATAFIISPCSVVTSAHIFRKGKNVRVTDIRIYDTEEIAGKDIDNFFEFLTDRTSADHWFGFTPGGKALKLSDPLPRRQEECLEDYDPFLRGKETLNSTQDFVILSLTSTEEFFSPPYFVPLSIPTQRMLVSWRFSFY